MASTSALIFRTSVPGFSPGRRPSLLVQSSPLPAPLAGDLPPVSRRGLRIRVVDRGISSGSAAAFRHRLVPPDLLLREPHSQPFARPFGVLRVLRWSHAEPCGPTRATRGFLGSLPTVKPHGLSSVSGRSPQFQPPDLAALKSACASYPALFARRIDTASASPLPPRAFPCWSPPNRS